tara:strand:+ start:180 stop:647 length:468 start_codon:yes stop_codon:yes gene_type:complete
MNKRKWYGYVFETQDDSYKQKLYKVPMHFKVRKTLGGNKSETEDDLRAVPYVTALSLPRDRKSDAENWYMTYDLKITKPANYLSIGDFVRDSLVPDVSKLRGVELLSYGEAFQVYDAQDKSIGALEKDKSKIFGGDKRRQSRAEVDMDKGDGDVS